jgi:hypothetical protein
MESKLGNSVPGPIVAVWAEEAGVQVRVGRLNEGQVWVAITDEAGNLKASATLGNWRWDRLVKTVEVPSGNED